MYRVERVYLPEQETNPEATINDFYELLEDAQRYVDACVEGTESTWRMRLYDDDELVSEQLGQHASPE
jgi:hypothetical protein